MKNLSILFSVLIVCWLAFIGCGTLAKILGDAVDPYPLLTIDILNDSTSTQGTHQEYLYDSLWTLTTVKVYQGDITGPFETPNETREYSSTLQRVIDVHITRSGGETLDSLYEYDLLKNLIKVEYKEGDQHEMDTMLFDDEGIPYETRHYSQGSQVRTITHNIDTTTGNITIDSLFTFPDEELIGTVNYSFSEDSLLTEKTVSALNRNGIADLYVEKFTYDSQNNLSKWEKFRAGGDEQLSESGSFTYNSRDLLTRAIKIDEVQGILLQIALFTYTDSSIALGKRANTKTTSDLEFLIPTHGKIQNRNGLSTQSLSDWDFIYQKHEDEK